MPKVTAIIHVTQRSRFVPGRYGQFVRPDGQPLHLWLGRELTIAEFNEHWPKAVKSVPDTVHVQIIERPDESDTILKSDHEQAMSAVQAGVDEFTKQCNDIIATKDARISELEKALAAVPTTPLPVLAEPVTEAEKTPVVTDAVAKETPKEEAQEKTVTEESTFEAEKTGSEGTDTTATETEKAAGDDTNTATVKESLTVGDPAAAAAPAAAPKPKAATKKAAPKNPKNTDSK